MSQAAAERPRSRGRVRPRRAPMRVVDGVSFSVRAGEAVGHRRRERLGQVDDLAVDPAARPRAAGAHLGADPVRGPRPDAAAAARACRTSAARDIGMIFQEPMTSLNPVMTIGRPDRRGDHAAREHEPRRAPRTGDRAAAACRHPRSGEPARAPIRTSSRAGCGSG